MYVRGLPGFSKSSLGSIGSGVYGEKLPIQRKVSSELTLDWHVDILYI